MASLQVSKNKPHAVCIPLPAQGHINPMLQIAKLLHHKGFHITFVNSEFNHKRLLKSKGSDFLNYELPSFRFETIPDGLPPSDLDATQDIASLCESTSKTCLGPFRDLLAKLNDTSSSNVPPVSCIISDLTMSFTLDAAQDLGIPDVLLWVFSPCASLAFTRYGKLLEMGYIPLKDPSYLTNGYLDTVVEDIPILEGIRLRDFPSFLRTSNPDDFMTKYVVQETERSKRASAFIFNTFEDLDHDFLNALTSLVPLVYGIGPLHLLEKQLANEEGSKELQLNLWKQEHECLDWLDSKDSNSVIYVNYGSIVVMTPNQLIEFAWGLANSNHNFLWIIRPDLVMGDKAILPPEFLEATKERGMLASWCPQEKVLGHHSIAGFLTHNGWNSTMESICSGVPMICWPFFADQQTNCWCCCKKWGIGMEIANDVKRDEVESVVKELVNGEKGKEMKKKVMKLSELAQESIKPNGSSNMNLDKLINQVLLPPPQM